MTMLDICQWMHQIGHMPEYMELLALKEIFSIVEVFYYRIQNFLMHIPSVKLS